MKFIIAALPRSRTAWLANFLTTDKTHCFHEPMADCATFSDIHRRASSKPIWGIADTAVGWFPDQLNAMDCAKVVIRHNPDEVARSLRLMGRNEDMQPLYILNDRLSRITRALVVPFEKINESLMTIWTYCTGLPFDSERAESLKNYNVQIQHLAVDPAKLLQLAKEIT